MQTTQGEPLEELERCGMSINLSSLNPSNTHIRSKLLHKEANIHVSLFNIYVPNIFAEKKRLLELFEGS